MRLSNAIMAGSTLIKWRAGSAFGSDSKGCAITMACKATGTIGIKQMQEKWPWVNDDAACPCCCDKWFYASNCVYGAIVHLFDEHVMRRKDWTLEQLCDWVRSVEPPEPSEATPIQQETVKETVGVCAEDGNGE